MAIAGKSIAAGRPVFFAVVADLMDFLKDSVRPSGAVPYGRLIDEVKNAELLVLDDLGVEQRTPWVDEKRYMILNHRYNARLPTVITSPWDFKTAEGPVVSRICDASIGTVIKMEGPDRRTGMTG